MNPCSICGTTEVPTFEAGGVYFCDGCAEFQTDLSAGVLEEE